MVKVFHYRDRCVGCANCVLVAPQYWQMNYRDGKADLEGNKTNKNVWVAEVGDEDLLFVKKAEQNCPVQVIRIVDQ